MNEPLLEIAALEALEPGIGPLEGRDKVKLHPAYAEAREDFDRIVELLAYDAPPVAPPPSLKERLLARIVAEAASDRALPEGGFVVKEGVTAVRTSDAPWRDTPLPGLETKVIHRDPERGYTTRLLRLQPGAGYPDHRHVGTEEIFVLEGSVLVNGTLLEPGDYCRSEAGTDESGTYSEKGAVAIVVSCDADEVSMPSDTTPPPG